MYFLKWLYPGMMFKRWLALFALGGMVTSLGIAVGFNYKYIDYIEEAIFRAVYNLTGSYDYTATAVAGGMLIMLGVMMMLFASRMVVRSVITVILPENSGHLVDVIYAKRKLGKGPAITVVGGGHGLSVLLRGIKQATSNVTAVVTVADDGGSSGRLREELGIVPPGDLRNCMVALADKEPLMEKLFQHRFKGCGSDGTLTGHSFGNLFIAAMAEVTGDIETALEESSKVLAVKGRVLPASKENVRLDAIMEDGTMVYGESHIPEVHKRIHRVQLFPQNVEAVASSVKAIMEAEAIVLGPGSLYTSVMPNLLVKGIGDAVCASKAVKIYICNVMTQPGETDGYTASMHVKAIQDHIGRNAVDFVIVNSTKVSDELKNKYAQSNQYPVEVDEDEINKLRVGVIKADLITDQDAIRHDPDKLCRCLMELVYDLKKDTY